MKTFSRGLVLAESTAMELRNGKPLECRGKTLLGPSTMYALLIEPFAKSPSGVEAAFDELDTRELLHKVRDRVRDSADAKNVDVLIYCTCTRIWALQALSEALYQLVKNAIHATRKGHPVVVDAREMDEGDVILQVQDTGVGMRPNVLGALGATAQSGTGHGVALAWAIVEQHEGLLRFESAPGVGTTATTWFPQMAVPRLRSSTA